MGTLTDCCRVVGSVGRLGLGLGLTSVELDSAALGWNDWILVVLHV